MVESEKRRIVKLFVYGSSVEEIAKFLNYRIIDIERVIREVVTVSK